MDEIAKMTMEIRSLHNKLQEAYHVRDSLRDSLAAATNEVVELREEVISLLNQIAKANGNAGS